VQNQEKVLRFFLLPGPMPTFTISAPLRISCSTISPVTTLPAWLKTQKNSNGGLKTEK
jgi:hypothetical protein